MAGYLVTMKATVYQLGCNLRQVQGVLRSLNPFVLVAKLQALCVYNVYKSQFNVPGIRNSIRVNLLTTVGYMFTLVPHFLFSNYGNMPAYSMWQPSAYSKNEQGKCI